MPQDLEARSWTVGEAYAYCEQLTRAHYENFPVGSLFIPKQKRPHIWSIYAFARTADDFADEAGYEGRRLELLQDWKDKLKACVQSPQQAKHPVFIALAETIRQLFL